MLRSVVRPSGGFGALSACFIAACGVLAACGGADFTSGPGGSGKSGAGGSAGHATGGKGGTAGDAGSGGSGDTGSGGSGEASAGGTSSGSGGGGGGGSGGVTTASCAGYIRAYCEWAERCGESVYGGSVEACVALSATSCDWYGLPGTGWNDSAFGACAEGYASAECGSTEAICETPKGTVQNGLECATQVQCESGYCTITSGGCGVCGPDPQHDIGGACQNFITDCKPGLDCVDKKCAARPVEGEPCDDSHHCTTAGIKEGYLYCVEGTCTIVGLPGSTCYDTGSSTPLCGFGAACTTENVCVRYVGGNDGDVCGTFSDEVIACPQGTCKADADDPTLLHCIDWAGPGERCDKVPGFSRCATGLSCVNDFCIWPELAEPPTDCGN